MTLGCWYKVPTGPGEYDEWVLVPKSISQRLAASTTYLRIVGRLGRVLLIDDSYEAQMSFIDDHGARWYCVGKRQATLEAAQEIAQAAAAEKVLARMGAP